MLRLLTSLLLLVVIYQCAQPAKESAPAPDPKLGGYKSQIEWGEHLVTVSGCNDCHTPKKMGPNGPEIDTSLRLSGHPKMMPKIDVNKLEMQQKGYTVTMDLTEWVGPWGTSYAANLTPDPTGTGNWTEENFTRALREGKFKGLANGRQLLPPMPWEMFRHMTDLEISAIFAYLQSIKPIANVVPAPLPPAVEEAPKPVEPKKKK